MALLAVVLGMAAPAGAKVPAAVGEYVQAPEKAGLQAPVRVVYAEGGVTDAEALSRGTGTTVLRYEAGGPAPIVILDFGKEIGGFPTFRVSEVIGAPVLRSSYSETLQGLSNDGDYAGKTRLTRVQELALSKPGRYRSEQIEGGQRYMRLTLSAPGTVSLTRAGIVYSAFRGTPKTLRGHFLSSDDQLNRIWYAGVHTLNLTQVVPGLRPLPGRLAERPVIVDGAKRDRRIWSGDLLIAGPTAYYSADPAYVRGSLQVIANHPGTDPTNRAPSTGTTSEPGPLPGVCSPNTRGGSLGCKFWSATYSMAFVNALYDYLRYTGDLRFVRKMWPTVIRQMAWNARLVGERGLVVVDDKTGHNWNLEVFTGELTYVNAVYHKTLTSAGAIAAALGQDDAAVFRRRARRVRDAVNRYLYDNGRGIYDQSTSVREPVVQDANVMAVLSGIASPERAVGVLRAIRRALANPYGQLTVSKPFPEGFRPKVSPYMSGFQLQATFEAGLDDDAFDLLRKEWGWMVRNDPGMTTWEKLQTDGTLTHRGSAAHAWGTGATSALSQYVLGAAPIDPGWRTWEVKPHPGDVEWARGDVPTPRGPLGVRWRAASKPAGFKLRVAAPKRTSGTVWLPVPAGRTVRRDGVIVFDGRARGGAQARREGEYVVVGGHTGTHRYAWAARRRG